MNLEIECSTAEQAYAAIKDGNVPVISGSIYLSVSTSCKIVCRGTRGSSQPHVVARESSQPHVVAWGSSQPHVVAWGSSQPHVEARESSQPHVVAWGSSQPHVVAWGSSQPHVVAWGSSQPHVEARESSQPHVEAWESSQPHVVAWGSSQPHVEARESSQPHVVAWGSSQPHVVAWGSSQPHVEARESSQPHVVASGYCQISIKGRVKLKAAATVAVLAMGLLAEIEGGGFVQRVVLDTPEKWCEHYGVEVLDGCATLFKAVDDEFRANYNGFQYLPGTTQRAPDWDPNPARECGGALHFSPSPRHAQRFHPNATRYVGVRVLLATLLVHPDGESPDKCRGPETLGCWEVDIYGKRIESPKAAAE